VLERLSAAERMRLMKFVCSFAWADLEVKPEERRFVAELIKRLELSAEESARVRGWLVLPPSPEAVDPTAIPHQHCELFLQEIEGVIASDGEIAPEEQESFDLMKALLSEVE
jgi:tellurite resistance protein